MTETPTASDWATARGEKWRDQLSGMEAMLAPGGRFAFAVWGPAADNPWMSSIREVAAAFIDVPPPDPDAPGPFRYGGADKLLALLDRAGFGDLEVRDWHGVLPIGGGLPPVEAADFALASFSVGELLADAGPETFESVRQALTDRFSQHQQGGVVRVDAFVHIVTGARSQAPGSTAP